MNNEEKKCTGVAFLMSASYVKERYGLDGVVKVRKEAGKTTPALKDFDPQDIKMMKMYPLSMYLSFLKAYYTVFGENSFERMSKRLPRDKERITMLFKPADSPEALIKNIDSYWRKLYNFGKMEGIITTKGSGEIYGNDIFVDKLFCMHITGYLKGSVERAGGKNVIVEHTECVGNGDGMCVWKITWE